MWRSTISSCDCTVSTLWSVGDCATSRILSAAACIASRVARPDSETSWRWSSRRAVRTASAWNRSSLDAIKLRIA